MGFSGSLTEIDQHDILQVCDFFYRLQLFTFLNVKIHELIGFFHIQTAGYGAEEACPGGGRNKDIFGVAYRRLSHFPFVQEQAVGMQKFFQVFCISAFYMVIHFQLKMVGVMQIIIFHVIHHAVKLTYGSAFGINFIFSIEILRADFPVVDALI